MTPNELKDRTKKFAIRVVRLCRSLPKTDEGRIIGRQLLRCATSVGANYRAVCRARSKNEFIAKLGIVIEEADESVFWLEIIMETGLMNQDLLKSLFGESQELLSIMVASRVSASHNQSAIKNHQS